MATIQGKSAVPTETVGRVPKRATGGDGSDRVLEIVRDGGDVYLHLHSPTNLANGWAITVPLEAFERAVRGL